MEATITNIVLNFNGYQYCVDAIDFRLVLEESQVPHVAHDAGEALQCHLVQLGRIQTQKRVLNKKKLT
jgi:hypothetical protein